MTTREALLAGIRAEPLAQLPRLVYADYLEDTSTDDRDLATAEFIRLSCFAGKSDGWRPMPKPTYPWLHANWPRLVPRFVAAHRPGTWLERVEFTTERGWRGWETVAHDNAPLRVATEAGRTIRVMIRFGYGHRPETNADWYSVTLEFWRGFLHQGSLWSRHAGPRLAGLLHADQPLAGWRFEKPHRHFTPAAFTA